jgi:phosphoribosylformylglycinamidine cyclo-ligase
VETGAWDRPAVFDLISERGVSEEDMRRTFNLGIGFCLVIDPAAAHEVVEDTSAHAPVVIGRVTGEEGVFLD